jgi:hypothetical protein
MEMIWQNNEAWMANGRRRRAALNAHRSLVNVFGQEVRRWNNGAYVSLLKAGCAALSRPTEFIPLQEMFKPDILSKHVS